MLRCLYVWFAGFVCAVSLADQEISPPVNKETIVGTWEALFEAPPSPPGLLRMEIRADGDSYVAQVVAGMRDVAVYRLVASDSKITERGEVEFHFQQVSEGSGIGHFWIRGAGSATPRQGIIEGKLGDVALCFLKGSWTRELALASERAEADLGKRHSK